jgi:hypothetical protein
MCRLVRRLPTGRFGPTPLLASAVFVATYIALGWLLPHP